MTTKPNTQLQPRLLSAAMAAAYCGLSAPTFRAECPVKPIRIRNRVLFDRHAIDHWIDQLGGESGNVLTTAEWLSRLD